MEAGVTGPCEGAGDSPTPDVLIWACGSKRYHILCHDMSEILVLVIHITEKSLSKFK